MTLVAHNCDSKRLRAPFDAWGYFLARFVVYEEKLKAQECRYSLTIATDTQILFIICKIYCIYYSVDFINHKDIKLNQSGPYLKLPIPISTGGWQRKVFFCELILTVARSWSSTIPRTPPRLVSTMLTCPPEISSFMSYGPFYTWRRRIMKCCMF